MSARNCRADRNGAILEGIEAVGGMELEDTVVVDVVVVGLIQAGSV